MFNPPPGFHETNGHIDDAIIKPPSKMMSSAISVADLERQLVYGFVTFLVILLVYHIKILLK